MVCNKAVAYSLTFNVFENIGILSGTGTTKIHKRFLF
jgi:hypothetical protein